MEHRKAYMFALIAIFLSLMAIGISNSVSSTYTNNTLGLRIETNYTNLNLTGERMIGVTYNATEEREIFLIGESYGENINPDLELYINNTLILDQDLHGIAVTHDNDISFSAIVPRDSFYRVEKSADVVNVSWIEFKIYSGNVTTIGAPINSTQLDSKINKSGDNMSGLVYNLVGDVYSSFDLVGRAQYTSTNLTTFNYSEVSLFPKRILLQVSNGFSNTIELMEDETTLSFNGLTYVFNATEIDLNGKNIVECGNCIDSGNYTGDGTTNRFIPYSINRIASKIDITTNKSTGNIYGEIILPGYIFSLRDGNRLTVSPHNINGFYVNDSFNLPVGNFTYYSGDNSSSQTGLNGYVRYSNFTAISTTQIINIGLNVQTTASGNARMAIYSSTAGAPDQLLNQTGSFALNTGWTNQSLITTISTGNVYWIAFQVDTAGTYIYRNAVTGVMKYNAQAYGAYPATAPAVSTSTGVAYNMEATVLSSGEVYYWTAI